MAGMIGTLGPCPFLTMINHLRVQGLLSLSSPDSLMCIPPSSVPNLSKAWLILSSQLEYLGRFNGRPNRISHEVSQMQVCNILFSVPAENRISCIPYLLGNISKSGTQQFPKSRVPSYGQFSIQIFCHPQIGFVSDPNGAIGFPIYPITPLIVASPPRFVFCPGVMPYHILSILLNSLLYSSMTADDKPGTLLAPVITVVPFCNALSLNWCILLTKLRPSAKSIQFVFASMQLSTM